LTDAYDDDNDMMVITLLVANWFYYVTVETSMSVYTQYVLMYLVLVLKYIFRVLT